MKKRYYRPFCSMICLESTDVFATSPMLPVINTPSAIDGDARMFGFLDVWSTEFE